jgi:hypothetical protein
VNLDPLDQIFEKGTLQKDRDLLFDGGKICV